MTSSRPVTSSTALAIPLLQPAETKISPCHDRLSRVGLVFLGLMLLAASGGMGYVTYLAKLYWNEKYSHMSDAEKYQADHNYESGDWGTIGTGYITIGLLICAICSVTSAFRSHREEPADLLIPAAMTATPAMSEEEIENTVIDVKTVDTQKEEERLTPRFW